MVDYRDNPAVHVFADTEAALAHMRGTAEDAGCRVVSRFLIGAQAQPWTASTPDATILIELETEAACDAAVPLLDWLRQEAEAEGRRAVISAPAGLIDLVAARAAHNGIEHLCAADEAERVTAVVNATRPSGARLHDVGRERSSHVLQPPPTYATDPAGPADAAFIRAMIRARRLREEHLPADLFADPAWDMLLDLMAARLEGKKVAVSSLCIAAAVPPTTALRWIAILTERGLLVRVADPQDGRRAYITLAERSARALGSWLRQAQRLTAEAV